MNGAFSLLACFMSFISYSDLLFMQQLALNGGASQPCEFAEARQFDFWLGEWEVTANNKLAGKSKISLAAGGCALLEEYESTGGYSGKSLNFYKTDLRKWQQVWVGSDGGVLILTGEYQGHKMILSGASQNEGKQVWDRITWHNNAAEQTVRQVWERSQDGGNSWKTVFDGLYTKKKS